MANLIPDSKLVRFSTVKPSSVIVSTETGNKYLTFASNDTDLNAVNIITGKLAYFDGNEKVLSYVGAKLVVVN
jgi:hypothetical protein